MFPSLILTIAAAATFGGIVLLLLLTIVVLSRHRKAGGREVSLMQRVASVTEPLNPEGAIVVSGELWRARARSGETVARGRANVRVVGARGHLLEVEPLG
ncbi:MAG TPA: NfeD family protein [Pyrinomonadaceae bacterium]|jgi:membrane-bound serine protease (ClpP class)|nr:NfeD family protein [Pyrinomonadaceae bacterium]